MTNFVITLTNDDLVQTFTFSGETSLEQVFADVELRNRRERSFVTIADELSRGTRSKVYTLTVNRDESQEEARSPSNMFDREPKHQQ
jgi:hypothetical protein